MKGFIMVQGTASGVGKSVLTTALCRIFYQDGHRVAPFKAQNLSCNAHTLPNGDLMARSVALSAMACGIAPCADMNPVLLMPSGGKGAQTVLQGKRIGTVTSEQFSSMREHAFSQVLQSFQRLSAEYDIVVIEGAGSPVEMNLLQDDIVNMAFAQAVDTPVLLISDISRGGIFASLYGTLGLLTPAQRELVKGLVVNKFFGEAAYFQDGCQILQSLCMRPVLGVIPYFPVQLEEEDALTDPGIAPKVRTHDGLEIEFDRLAALFRAYLDMERIYSIVKGGKDA